MIYLDYSANTPADPRVLDRFCTVERSCIGNANSHHQAGAAAKAEIDAATMKIASLLGVQPPRSSILPAPASPTTLRSRGWRGSPAMWASTSSLLRWSTPPSAAR